MAKSLTHAHHLISTRNWEGVQKSGFLKPMTEPSLEHVTLESARALIKNKRYIVCVPSGDFKIWEYYSMLDSLKRRVVIGEGCGYDVPKRNEFMHLEVPIINPKGAFVREHWFSTRDYGDMKMYGAVSEVQGMYDTSGMNMATKKEIEFVGSLWDKYRDSAVSLSEYQGQFKIPEIWLPQRTPVNLVKILNTRL